MKTLLLVLIILAASTPSLAQQPKATSARDLAGTYVGSWYSEKYDVSGSLVMTVRFSGETPEVSVVFTGSEYLNRDTLIVSFSPAGDGVWTMEYKGRKSKIKGTGIFVEDTFVGDYKFSKLLWTDRGKWKLVR